MVIGKLHRVAASHSLMSWVVVAALLLSGDLAHAGEDTRPGHDQLNLVLISLDTVRPDHLSAYGYHRKTSPEIDRIAREGAVFTNAFSQNQWTVLSHLSLFSSRYPRDHWFREDGIGPDPSVGTLTEILKQHGYQTAACTGFKNAFHKAHGQMLTSGAFQAFDFMLFDRRLSVPPRETFEWLVEHRDRPFFLFLHGFDAHEPHVVSPAHDARIFARNYKGDLPFIYMDLPSDESVFPDQMQDLNQRERDKLMTKKYRELYLVSGEMPPENLKQMLAMYDAQIRFMDHGLGYIFTALRNLDVMRRTLVVIISDHGQAFGEHGEYAAHGTIYDEVSHMVLIVRDPRLRPRRSRIHTVVEGIDVMPTILELLDLPVPETAEGKSLARLMETGRDPTLKGHALSFAQHSRRRSIRTKEWKMLGGGDGWDELYHLTRDPGEQKNVMERYPSVVSELRKRFETSYQLEQEEELGQNPKAWIQEHGYW